MEDLNKFPTFHQIRTQYGYLTGYAIIGVGDWEYLYYGYSGTMDCPLAARRVDRTEFMIIESWHNNAYGHFHGVSGTRVREIFFGEAVVKLATFRKLIGDGEIQMTDFKQKAPF